MTNYESVLLKMDKPLMPKFLNNTDDFCCGTYVDGNGCCATEMRCKECIEKWLDEEMENKAGKRF